MAPTDAQAYVRRLYSDLFGRSPDPGGFANWTSLLVAGTPRGTVTAALASSDEYRTRLVTAHYRKYLGRTPDAGGLSKWLRAMRGGMRLYQLDVALVTSPEYDAKYEFNYPWPRRLYEDVLGRSDDIGAEYWEERLAAGMPRTQVARAFVLSTEHLNLVVDRYYQSLLDRFVDPGGRRSWVGALRSGTHDETLIGAIAASAEYVAKPPGVAGDSAYVWGIGTATPERVGTNTHWAFVTAVNYSSSMAIRTDGSLWTWGGSSEPTRVGTDTHWASVTAGESLIAGLKTNGTLWAWGSNGPVQVGTDTHWASVATGVGHTAAIKTDGTLWTWGDNDHGQLGDGSTTGRPSPVQVGSDTHWASVTAGLHTVAVKTDGTLWAWGDNSSGQLGTGTTTDQHTPVQIGADTHWASVASGISYTVALKTDGTLWTWGSNFDGQLGDGTTTDRPAPVQVGTDTHWATLAASDSAFDSAYTMAIRTDGSLWGWGSNGAGQLGDGTTTDRHAPVRSGTDTGWEAVALGLGYTVALRPTPS